MSAPRVSIVLPSRDGAAHLDEAVRSVEAQTFEDWELVLVDDGSRDATGALMDAAAARDARIGVLHLDPNRGLPAALNEGFRHARGELLSWTSDDNAYLPQALDRMRAVLDDDPGADLVYADYRVFGEGTPERRVEVGPPERLPVRSVVGACFLYRREVHEALGGFDEDLFLAEDYDFWLRASTRFRLVALHEPLYRYREHAGSLTARHRLDAYRAAVRALERHLGALAPEVRADALLVRARRLLALGDARLARRLVRRALAESAGVALRAEHRLTLATAALGRPAARTLRAAARRLGRARAAR